MPGVNEIFPEGLPMVVPAITMLKLAPGEAERLTGKSARNFGNELINILQKLGITLIMKEQGYYLRIPNTIHVTPHMRIAGGFSDFCTCHLDFGKDERAHMRLHSSAAEPSVFSVEWLDIDNLKFYMDNKYGQEQEEELTCEIPYKRRLVEMCKGNATVLAEVGFQHLKRSEKELLRNISFQYKENGQFHLLTARGYNIVEAFRRCEIAKPAIYKKYFQAASTYESRANFFINHTEQKYKKAQKLLTGLRSGKNPVTKGLSCEQIEGYRSIAMYEFAPEGFEEPFSVANDINDGNSLKM